MSYRDLTSISGGVITVGSKSESVEGGRSRLAFARRMEAELPDDDGDAAGPSALQTITSKKRKRANEGEHALWRCLMIEVGSRRTADKA